MLQKRRLMLWSVGAAILLALTVWILWGNGTPELTEYTVQSENLPESFDGFRVAQISDLHNARMGQGNEKLLFLLREAHPDLIALTGDLVDSRRTNLSVALEFVKEALKIAPCYYVPGNHESRIEEYTSLRSDLVALGVVVLENESISLTQGEESIALLGVCDPSFVTETYSEEYPAIMESYLQSMSWNKGFSLLLAHRPELIDVYADFGVDLVLSGHAHGGQLRLPFVGGVYAPGQGFFPKYDAGVYEKENTTLVVSRGIGNSRFPFRVNNRPEVVLVILQAAA